ncbi:MAG TPA: VWA domain-containing protein, partial [Enhygromyxa sp.]|nr:VWA domain-containing protein [Enhygromyxa sp.]
QKIRFAAVRFVTPREPVITQRRELRDRPLLLVRLLLLAVLVLVLARPVISSEAAVAVIAEPHDAVILLDASGSMELQVDGRSDRERALERLDTLLEAIPPGSRVGLVISDPRAPTVELTPVSEAVPRIRATLDGWQRGEPQAIRPGGWSLAEALPRATSLLIGDGGSANQRAIYAIGDPTDRGLGSLPSLAEGAITVIPIPTRGAPGQTPPDPPEHVGIRELSWEPAPELDPKAVRITALLHRHGGGDDELEVTAALEIDGDEVARTAVELLANGDAAAEFTHTLADTDSGAQARVRLLDREDDPLRIDDRRHLWIAASEAIGVLIVNGDPSETRAHDEIFFLSTALQHSELADRLEVRGLALDQLEDRLRAEQGGAPLAEVDVLMLANVRALPSELVPLIVERVEAGMGLWISVGDRVSASDYNSRFGPLLPLLLREAVYAGTAPGRTEARSEGLAPVQLSHPIFAGAASESNGDLDLGATRTRRMFLLEPDPRRGADVAVAFTSGAPALITREHGSGRVALLTTTIDRDWGDLPLRPGFVPLAIRTIAWLAGAHEQAVGGEIVVGGRKQLARAAAYTVTTPAGASVPVTPTGEDQPAVFEATDAPGHYRASVVGDDQVERFVVEFDALEADTTPVAIAGSTLEGEGGTVKIYEPRWRELAMIMLLLLGLESGARLWLSRRGSG